MFSLPEGEVVHSSLGRSSTGRRSVLPSEVVRLISELEPEVLEGFTLFI